MCVAARTRPQKMSRGWKSRELVLGVGVKQPASTAREATDPVLTQTEPKLPQTQCRPTEEELRELV